MGEYVAIDVGGTKIAIGIGNKEGAFHAHRVLATDPSKKPDTVLDEIAAATAEAIREAGLDTSQLNYVGLGSPGPLDGSVIMGTSNLHGWTGLDWRAGLETRLKVPVAVQNDATAAGLGEWRYGAGRGTQYCVYVTISTGIGAGIVADGVLYSGAHGNAGEFGHLVMQPDGFECPAGHRGCLESLASGTAIARKGRERQAESAYLKAIESLDTKDVFEGMEAGDPVCAQIIDEAADWLGLGLSYLINLFNPEKIIIGGGVGTHAPSSYFQRVWTTAQRSALPAMAEVVQLVPAELGSESGLIGALAVAVMADSRDGTRL